MKKLYITPSPSTYKIMFIKQFRPNTTIKILQKWIKLIVHKSIVDSNILMRLDHIKFSNKNQKQPLSLNFDNSIYSKILKLEIT